ncbi:MAG: SpoIIE family protein phosphatase, partial [Blautia sp.]|nr:SpoIIE family protein phosphatase [Blautia sp.]
LLRTTYIYDSLNPALPFERYPLGYTAEDMDPIYLDEIKLVLGGGRSQKYAYSYGESGAHTTTALSVANAAGEIVAMVFVEKPMTALVEARNTYVRHVTMTSIIIILSAIFLFTFFLQRVLVQPIKEITAEAKRFAEDHEEGKQVLKCLDHRYEIGVLARSIKKMENDIHVYIDDLTRVTAEKERIGAELSVATQIQADMLPRIFPPFPGRSEFDLHATMTPAKEVGGDFYDFFMVDKDLIGLVMADVSGKGVPAALFMLIAKTLLKKEAQRGGTPGEILEAVNNQLCEGNEAELFVTVWIALLDLSTGKGVAANAGHEHPAICRAGGDYELLKYRHSPAVAVMEGIPFMEHSFELHPGDSLYVYTDGVPEATNADGEMFGTDKMLEALNQVKGENPRKILATVKQQIDAFVGEAIPFDDITMLALNYYGPQREEEEKMNPFEKEFVMPATKDSIMELTAKVDEQLEALDCSIKSQTQLDVAIDEIYANIASYAYPEGGGQVTVRFSFDEESRAASLTFIDQGIPFNPLLQAEPDLTLAAEERAVGGLGIYLVMKTMDEMDYRYEDGKNILTIKKKI